ncbi:MAG: S8/S53 family peptidase [Actinoplanes sp.]
MPTYYSDNSLTIGPAGAGAERINDVLAARGLGRLLARPIRIAGGRLAVQVADGTAEAVLRAIEQAGLAEDVRRDPLFHNGTFPLLGARTPHAFTPEVMSTTPPVAPPWTPPPAGMRRPVIALLDGAVLDHPWLPKTSDDDPFLLDAEDPALEHPWSSRLPPGTAGHATFLAGVIRAAAPGARILAVRIAGDDGAAEESTLIGALEWLHEHTVRGHPVDVVCLPLGRMPGAEDDRVTLAGVERAIGDLVGAGIPVAASAGNDHVDTPVYPAAFRGVTAVGAGISGYHARFSNHGGWVDRYREGVDVQSVLPPDGWARWSGTSFSVAHFVADLARPQVV